MLVNDADVPAIAILAEVVTADVILQSLFQEQGGQFCWAQLDSYCAGEIVGLGPVHLYTISAVLSSAAIEPQLQHLVGVAEVPVAIPSRASEIDLTLTAIPVYELKHVVLALLVDLRVPVAKRVANRGHGGKW